MIDHAKVLQRKMGSLFSDDLELSKVMAELARYGKEVYEQEIERVRLAILKNAGTNLDEIKIQVDTAKIDYRDVLAWAEYPNQMKVDTCKISREETKHLVEKDMQQYQAWLEE